MTVREKVDQNACDCLRACGITTENSVVFDFPWHHRCAEPASRLPSVHKTTTAHFNRKKKRHTGHGLYSPGVVSMEKNGELLQKIKFSGLETVPIHQTDAQQLEVASRVCS